MTRSVVLAAMLAVGVTGMALAQTSPRAQKRLERAVHHELVMLPYYGLFDNLAFNPGLVHFHGDRAVQQFKGYDQPVAFPGSGINSNARSMIP